MSNNARYNDSDIMDTSDEDEGEEMEETSGQKKNTPRSAEDKKSDKDTPKNINEALKLALEKASAPGHGDEEPEVLPAPDQPAYASDTKRTHEDDEEHERDTKQRGEESQAASALSSSTMEYYNNLDAADTPITSDMKERAKYIPLRLTYEERKTLRLVSAAVNVSDYTTNIDVSFKNKAKRYHMQLQHIVAFLTGVIAATNYEQGQSVMKDRNFEAHEKLLQSMLEIVRRYKVLNPEKLRSEYGKLVYLMQDAASTEIKPLLNIDVFAPVKTVYKALEEVGGLAVLEDKYIHIATEEILPDKNKARAIIQADIKRKEKAVEIIVKNYSSHRVKADLIRQCLYSIGDNNSFLNSNKKPVEDCIELLQAYFRPEQVEKGFSLGIKEGEAGARLTHSHELQYHFVLQSLSLWSNILEDMFRLWYLAEQDLLCGLEYELKNTGQGLQRVQQSPRVYKAMHEILVHTQHVLGNWVGSSVIHLGDHNVPNALVFIDKYTQVARILGPLVTTLRNLDTLCEENEGLNRYLMAYGGIDKAKKDILCDFFTHAFDGSGGDNFFDAGSCIDGRLTSAWNWCSQLASKPYYPLFRLTGFLSFDGEFDK